jgi:putative endonuclease
MEYSVYILYSKQHGKYYIGQTNDIQDRLNRHNSGYVLSTKQYLPWEMVWNTNKARRSETMILEKKLKNLSKTRIENFIEKYKDSSPVADEA